MSEIEFMKLANLMEHMIGMNCMLVMHALTLALQHM